MRLGAIGAGLTAWVGAALSSLCCLLPLAVIVLVVVPSIVLDRFPELTSDVLAHVMSRDRPQTKHDMEGMR